MIIFPRQNASWGGGAVSQLPFVIPCESSRAVKAQPRCGLWLGGAWVGGAERDGWRQGRVRPRWCGAGEGAERKGLPGGQSQAKVQPRQRGSHPGHVLPAPSLRFPVAKGPSWIGSWGGSSTANPEQDSRRRGTASPQRFPGLCKGREPQKPAATPQRPAHWDHRGEETGVSIAFCSLRFPYPL